MNAGFTVVLAGRRMEMLQETKKLGDNVGKSLCVSADMTDPGSIAALFAKVKATYGRLDVLFNNAGMGAPPVNFEDLTLAQWQAVVEHQPHRAVPVHPARLPDHEGPEPARRPHHQQRLDLGARAAAVLRGLYLDQARHHRPDQGDQPRRPRVRHRGRTDRHRQCRDANDRPHGRRRAAARRPQDPEPRMDAKAVGDAVAYMAGLPLDANVLFMTVMATKMPFVGRGPSSLNRRRRASTSSRKRGEVCERVLRA